MGKFYAISVYALVFFGSIILAYPQQNAKMTPDGVGYLEHLPSDYTTNTSRQYPVIIFLHGAGEVGNGSPSDLNKLKIYGPPKLIDQGHPMCFTVNGVEECFIVISPQLRPDAGGWWPSILTGFFDYILNGSQNYRIDRNRVYLTGLSLGGEGVYIGLGETPDVFAAASVIAGFNNGNGCTISARKIPVWGFHGLLDTTVPYTAGLTEFSRIGWCTTPVPTAELKWTSYVGIGHNSWDNAYTADHSIQTPNLYEWFLSKSKGSVNSSPIANAGIDRAIMLPTNTLTLAGSGTDPDGTISSYQWTKVSGPAATLTNVNTATLSLSNLLTGSYVFRLTVADNLLVTAFDDVIVTVNTANQLPVPNAGVDRIITLPASTLTITGSATDPDGTIASYLWTKVSGPTATLTNANTATLSLSSLLAGSYTFRLTVTDNQSASASDDVIVTVNRPPVPNAGTDRIITLPTNSLTLTGSATDPDGTIASYLWTKVSGPAATLTNANTTTLDLSNLLAGTYTFRLIVTDNLSVSVSDDVIVTVNQPPVPNAGTD